MTGASEPRSLLDAAEEAAAGDLEAAEALLRQALALQEASLGPLHPDLAHTLNNLAVVCERREKLADAERGYRRAHAIAVASLKPGNPLVATSLKNLVDFCAARQIPLWTPPAARPVVEPTSEDLVAPPAVAPDVPEVRRESVSVTRVITRRVAAIVVLSVGLLVILWFGPPWRGSGGSTERLPEARSAPPPPPDASVLPPPASPTSASAVAPDPQPVAPSSETNPREDSRRVESDRPSGSATRAAASVDVLTAQVCSALERRGAPDWQCTPVSGFSQPGSFTFYTRILAEHDTTIEHRWYFGNRLHWRMKLGVRASPSSGFRTYSRNTVSADRAGDWRVELRASDGTLLREEHFVVR